MGMWPSRNFLRVSDLLRSHIAAAAVEDAKKKCIAEIYQERQDLVRCIANDKFIIETIERWTNYKPDVLPSKAIFDQVISENPDHIKAFVRQPLARAKEPNRQRVYSTTRRPQPPRSLQFGRGTQASEPSLIAGSAREAGRVETPSADVGRFRSCIEESCGRGTPGLRLPGDAEGNL